MASVITTVNLIKINYLPLIKSRQTFLLTLTGIAGYLSRATQPINWLQISGLLVSLLASISGCTILNMLLDRDIDRKMVRTHGRPLADGRVNPTVALYLGCGLVASGLMVAASLSQAFFIIILAGVGLNVLVYTLWLKRRSAWSILWGGLSGGMPILAGSVLAVGRIDFIGVLLALIIVCWIPSHNLTLITLHSADYLNAGVPTLLSRYGAATVHLLTTISSLLVAELVFFVSTLLGFSGLRLAFIIAASLGLVCLGVISWINPSQKLTTAMYKFSSIYMLVTMLILSTSGLVR
jgi:heme o synthase